MSAAAIPTGYLDSFGHVWVFNDGYTVIDGKVVRGSIRPGQRRMLQPGDEYIDTHGVRCVVPEPTD